MMIEEPIATRLRRKEWFLSTIIKYSSNIDFSHNIAKLVESFLSGALWSLDGLPPKCSLRRASERFIARQNDLSVLEFLLIDLNLFEMKRKGWFIGFWFLVHEKLTVRSAAMFSDHFCAGYATLVKQRGLHSFAILLHFSYFNGLFSVLLDIS